VYVVLLVKMPSRRDTLQWLGDDVTSLPGKVSDILKHDVSITASPAIQATGPRTTNGKVDLEEIPHPDLTFSNSFSPPGGSLSDSDTQRPMVDVDDVADAVGRLSVTSSTAANSDGGLNVSSVAVDLAAAAEPAADTAVNGAVGGRVKEDSLFSMLAQFADDTVCWQLL